MEVLDSLAGGQTHNDNNNSRKNNHTESSCPDLDVHLGVVGLMTSSNTTRTAHKTHVSAATSCPPVARDPTLLRVLGQHTALVMLKRAFCRAARTAVTSYCSSF